MPDTVQKQRTAGVDQSGAREILRRLCLYFARGVAIVLAVVTVLSCFGQRHFLLDILSNFRMHFALLFVPCVVIFAIAHKKTWAAVAMIGLLFNATPVASLYLAAGADPAPGGAESVTVMISNVLMRNRQYGDIERLVAEDRPDILGLIEVDKRWLDNLPSIRSSYPYAFEAAEDDYTGLALYSKLPFSEARVVRFGQVATPSIVATFVLSGQAIELILTHPRAPMNAGRAASRNAELSAIAAYIQASDKPVLLTGDLNTTMWSSYYVDFERRSGLQNARAGQGVGTTWPPVHGFGVPIDHILATSALHMSNFRVHRRVGSDHLPISAEVGVLSQHAGLLSCYSNSECTDAAPARMADTGPDENGITR